MWYLTKNEFKKYAIIINFFIIYYLRYLLKILYLNLCEFYIAQNIKTKMKN